MIRIVAPLTVLLGVLLPSCHKPQLGRVVDEQGNPVVGARVVLVPMDAFESADLSRGLDDVRGPDVRETVSDGSGAFRFDKASLFDMVLMVDPGDGGAVTGQLRVDSSHITLRTHRGLSLGGVVLDGDGEPVPNLEVFVDHERILPRFRVTTDSRGRFLVGPVVREPYRITAPSCEEVRAVGGERFLVLRQHPRVNVQGRVVHADGSPAAHCLIHFLHEDPEPQTEIPTVRTDAQGRFERPSLQTGKYVVRAWARLSTLASITSLEVEEDSPLDVTLTLETASILAFDVVDSWIDDVSIWRDGLLLARGPFDSEDSLVLTPGETEVVVGAQPMAMRLSRTVSLEPGSTHRFVLRGPQWNSAPNWQTQELSHAMWERDFQRLSTLCAARLEAIRGRVFETNPRMEMPSIEPRWPTDASIARDPSNAFDRHFQFLPRRVSAREWYEGTVTRASGYCGRDWGHPLRFPFGFLFELAVVHELAHRLQAQERDVDAIVAEVPNGAAILEGEANLLTALYAQEFVDWPEEEKRNLRAKFDARDFPESVFVANVYDQRGWEGIEALYSNPPSREQLEEPTTFLDGADPEILIRPDDLESLVSEGWALIEEGTAGFMRIVDFVGRCGDRTNRSLRTARGWGGDTYRLFGKNGSEEISRLLWWTTWDTENDALEFFDAAQERLCSMFDVDPLGESPFNETAQWRTLGGAPGRQAHIEWRGSDVVIVEGYFESEESFASMRKRMWTFTMEKGSPSNRRLAE